ncbi:hypothetical protein BJ912DRAFT_1046453 [Pholiota molesta]|nr:hypothetical protein BJ912DRAFT_1046453 [Pholiota molesta]
MRHFVAVIHTARRCPQSACAAYRRRRSQVGLCARLGGTIDDDVVDNPVTVPYSDNLQLTKRFPGIDFTISERTLAQVHEVVYFYALAPIGEEHPAQRPASARQRIQSGRGNTKEYNRVSVDLVCEGSPPCCLEVVK